MKQNLANVNSYEFAKNMKLHSNLALYDNGEIEDLEEDEMIFERAYLFSYDKIVDWNNPKNRDEEIKAVADFIDGLKDNWQLWF